MHITVLSTVHVLALHLYYVPDSGVTQASYDDFLTTYMC